MSWMIDKNDAGPALVSSDIAVPLVPDHVAKLKQATNIGQFERELFDGLGYPKYRQALEDAIKNDGRPRTEQLEEMRDLVNNL